MVDDLQGALDDLRRFTDLYETGAIPEYHHTVDTILNRADEILNWHHGRRSNGPLERTNNLDLANREASYRPSADPPTASQTPKCYTVRGLLLT